MILRPKSQLRQHNALHDPFVGEGLGVQSLEDGSSKPVRVKITEKLQGTNLPELFRRIFARNPLQDFGAARMLVHEVGHIVHVVVHDDVHALVGRVVGFYFGLGDCFGHVQT